MCMKEKEMNSFKWKGKKKKVELERGEWREGRGNK